MEESRKEVMRMKRSISHIICLLLLVLHITSAQNTSSTTTTSAPNPAALGYRTRPTNITVALGDPAEFHCGVAESSPNFTFTLYGIQGSYILTCPSGHMEDIPQALYGKCDVMNGESLAVWMLKGTSLSDNGTRVVCQQSGNPVAPAAVLRVYDNGASYATLIGCAIGGFFGMLLVFGLAFTMLQRSETLQRWFRGKDPEDDMKTIVTKE